MRRIEKPEEKILAPNWKAEKHKSSVFSPKNELNKEHKHSPAIFTGSAPRGRQIDSLEQSFDPSQHGQTETAKDVRSRFQTTHFPVPRFLVDGVFE